MLNDSRSRIKAVLLTTRDFFQTKSGGLSSVAQGAVKNRIDEEIVPALKKLLEETELGVIDHKKLKGDEPDTEDITNRLKIVYANAADTLRELSGQKNGAAPARDGDSVFN